MVQNTVFFSCFPLADSIAEAFSRLSLWNTRNKASIISYDTAICCSINFKYGVELCFYILSFLDGLSLLLYLVSSWCRFSRTACFARCSSYSHNHSQFQEAHQRRKDLLVVVLSVRRLRHLCSSTDFHKEPEYDCHLFLSHHRHLHHPVPRKVRHSDEGTLEQHATPTTPSDFHLPARRFCVAVRFRCAVKPKKTHPRPVILFNLFVINKEKAEKCSRPFLVGSVIGCGWFISTVWWKIQPFSPVFPLADSMAEAFSRLSLWKFKK